MNIQREWVTPVAMGTFFLVAVTGVLMFFHLDTGLNKVAHEWLSWLLLIGVALHAVANFGAVKRHFTSPTGRILLGISAALLLLTFIPSGEKTEPPFAVPVRALAQTSLSNLASVAGVSVQEMRVRLELAGLRPLSDEQTLRDLTGADLRRQMHILEAVLGRK